VFTARYGLYVEMQLELILVLKRFIGLTKGREGTDCCTLLKFLNICLSGFSGQ
jgi:hypothetical protein